MPSVAHHEVSFTLKIPAFSLDERAKLKLPLLLIILLLFSFSIVMLDRANFKTMDLFDLTRSEYNFGKVYSVNFILFVLLLSLDLAMAAYYGNGLSPTVSALLFPVLLVGSLLLGVVFPSLSLPSIAIALAVSFAGLISSFYQNLSFRNSLSLFGKAMVLFVVLAFLIGNANVSANKSLYEETFFSSLSSGSNQSIPVPVGLTRQEFDELFSNQNLTPILSTIPGLNSSNSSNSSNLENTSAQIKSLLLTNATFEKISSKIQPPSQVTLTTNSLKSISGVKMLSNNLGLYVGFLIAGFTAILSIILTIVSSILLSLLVKATS